MPSTYNCTGCNVVFDTKTERKNHFRNVCQALLSVTDTKGTIHRIERIDGKFTCPICIFQSRDPLGTNKNDGAGWRKLRAAICAIIFAVPRPLLQSPEGDYDGAISQSRGLEK